ncbi:hypothetical protein Xclt_08435 [Xanthomonas axonopodis pv. clitoriae]|uniref:Uncharacterized protein n=1 Tax=Xanthomonas axonopodis pv. clitoriae TaxID=487828 RepID=A0AB73MRD3_9XANT|nr:hypothetical protein Xclt_08435 [Xanthomonas axonopodis pv. clitoriae]
MLLPNGAVRTFGVSALISQAPACGNHRWDQTVAAQGCPHVAQGLRLSLGQSLVRLAVQLVVRLIALQIRWPGIAQR